MTYRTLAKPALFFFLASVFAVSFGVESASAQGGAARPSSTDAVATKRGLLKGAVVSSETGEPVAGVRVTAERSGHRYNAKTAADGRFELELPPGTYRLVFSHPQYDERTSLNVPIQAGRVQESEIALHPGSAAKAEDLEEIVVTGKYLDNAVAQERFSESVIDMLGAEDWQVTGDSDVTDALSRVAGVTIVDDKFVYIRGLGERYASTLFNNAFLPSPDPARRVVPLDLFPSGVMKQLEIQKTYAPYLPADFSGGSLLMTTKDIPAEGGGTLGVEIEYNTETTFKNRRMYDGDDWDWTGFDVDGFRDFPNAIQDASVNGRLPFPSILPPEVVREVGLSLDRKYDENTDTVPPNVGVDGNYGNTYESRIGDFGFLVGGRYKNEWQYTDEKRREAENSVNGAQVKDDFDEEETVNTIKWSGLGVGEWSLDDEQVLKLTGFYSRITDKRYISSDGFLGENERFVEQTTWEWEERELWSIQLVGDHAFPDFAQLSMDWGVTYSESTRDKPDSRFYEYELDFVTGEYVFANERASNFRQWEDLKDEVWDVYLDQEIPIVVTEDILSAIRIGGKYFDKDRDSKLRRFRYSWRGTSEEFADIRDGTPTEVFADENIGKEKWGLEEVTTFSDSYTADEKIAAGYFQTDTDFFVDWRLMAGFRYEWSKQNTETEDPRGGAKLENEIKDDYVLPAVALTWAFRDDMQIRAAFSQTINRPDIREISDSCYLDAEDRDVICGNGGLLGLPPLEIAEINNYDLRWEWYYGDENNMSFAAFYKELDKPIEEIAIPEGGSGSRRTYVNADDGWLYGFEFAMRQDLAFAGDWGRDFYFKFNGSIIDSEVKRSAEDVQGLTNDKGELQGQSPWIVNFIGTYDNLLRDLQATVAFNIFGKRITDLGIRGLPDAKEQPAPRLDFNLRKGFEAWGQYMTVQFKAENLIDPNFEIERGSVTERKFQKGVTLKLALDVEF